MLLSLVRSGEVARLKNGMREVGQMTTWVFAGINRNDRLPPELLSWFVSFNFIPCTREEFLEMAREVITGQSARSYRGPAQVG